ncbi:MAG: hypothetical protein ACOZFS_15905 [Thermodesulfobacteriota bacterium]
MKRIKRVVFLTAALWVALGGTAQAYHIQFIFEEGMDYAQALANSQTAEGINGPDGTSAHALDASAESQVFTRPLTATDPLNDIILKVNNSTTESSVAYGGSEGKFNFIIIKDAGDIDNQANVTFDFQATGGFNLATGAISGWEYALMLSDGVNLYDNGGEYFATGTHNDSFSQTYSLNVEEQYLCALAFNAYLARNSAALENTWSDAWYKGDLNISLANVPLPPAFLLLGGGLIRLISLVRRRQRI